MNTPYDGQLKQIQGELKKILVQWAADKTVDEDRARSLREQAARVNYLRYRQGIPYFAKVLDMAGMTGDSPDMGRIMENCLVPDDIFKSYPQAYLDDNAFEGMNQWLSNIAMVRPNGKSATAADLDQWIDYLGQGGVHLVFSSGTSGNMSFVPRDESTWFNFLRNALLYLPLVVAEQGVVPAWKYHALKLLAKNVQPDRLLSLAEKYGRLIFREYDGYFCNFSGGNQGIQLVGQELSRFCGSSFFLYDMTLSPAAVRGIIRGARTEQEQELINAFLKTTVMDKEKNYDRMLEALGRSVKRGRKVMIFGTPYLLMEICQKIQARKLNLKLKKGSNVLFGGGWKSFDGKRIPEDELTRLMSEAFGIEPRYVSEGYSMTEIQGLMIKCPERRYHVPPHFETVILDEQLKPIHGDDVTGALGIIDPFAESYAGFLITGDHVQRLAAPCPCGRTGYSIVSIERSPGREVKGCGGIMAKINA